MKRSLLLILSILLSLALISCATPSQEFAGITQFQATPVIHDGKVVAVDYKVQAGKEYADFTLDLQWEDGELRSAHVHARDVKAFEGQAISAQAITEIHRALAEAGVEISEQASDIIRKALVPLP